MRTRTGRAVDRARSALLALALAGCASGPPPAPPPEWSAARTRAADALEAALAGGDVASEGDLVVRLAFAADADLDLYVTDPRLETLYYANSPVKSGGVLRADRRCDDGDGGGARIEVARFASPLPGRYRVGVDFPHACDGGVEVAPWVLSVESPKGRRILRGLAQRLRFDSIVLEFELP